MDDEGFISKKAVGALAEEQAIPSNALDTFIFDGLEIGKESVGDGLDNLFWDDHWEFCEVPCAIFLDFRESSFQEILR